jgi:hypothetical protein
VPLTQRTKPRRPLNVRATCSPLVRTRLTSAHIPTHPARRARLRGSHALVAGLVEARSANPPFSLHRNRGAERKRDAGGEPVRALRATRQGQRLGPPENGGSVTTQRPREARTSPPAGSGPVMGKPANFGTSLVATPRRCPLSVFGPSRNPIATVCVHCMTRRAPAHVLLTKLGERRTGNL